MVMNFFPISIGYSKNDVQIVNLLKSLQEKILSDSTYKHLHLFIKDWLEDSKDEILEIIEDCDTSDPY